MHFAGRETRAGFELLDFGLAKITSARETTETLLTAESR
jgi:hypothetical protein